MLFSLVILFFVGSIIGLRYNYSLLAFSYMFETIFAIITAVYIFSDARLINRRFAYQASKKNNRIHGCDRDTSRIADLPIFALV